MNSTTIEMTVDTVGSMSKTGAKCVLKGEKEINGFSTKFTLTIACNELGVFDDLDVSGDDGVVDMVLKDPAQQSLFDEEDVDIEIHEA